jgi:hypothetical protein
MKNSINIDIPALDNFEIKINNMLHQLNWTKSELVDLFLTLIPNFEHLELKKDLDEKM